VTRPFDVNDFPSLPSTGRNGPISATVPAKITSAAALAPHGCCCVTLIRHEHARASAARASVEAAASRIVVKTLRITHLPAVARETAARAAPL
jgi:hypothetical protein